MIYRNFEIVQEIRRRAMQSTPTQLAREYNIPLSTIRSWLANDTRDEDRDRKHHMRKHNKPTPLQQAQHEAVVAPLPGNTRCVRSL